MFCIFPGYYQIRKYLVLKSAETNIILKYGTEIFDNTNTYLHTYL